MLLSLMSLVAVKRCVVFSGEMRELILRRPQQQEDSTNIRNQLLSDEVCQF